MQPTLPTNKIKTDVLVIGAGAAGMTAALEAKSKGLDVTIISKSKVGRSGNTIISGTGMAILDQGTDSQDSPQAFKQDTLRSGKEINDHALVDLYLKHSPKLIDRLIDYGVALKKMDDRWLKKRAPGHCVARSFSADFSHYPYMTKGLSLTLPLLKSAEQSGIRIIDFAPVIKLLISDGCIAGAVAISKKTKAILIIRTPVVILASGGCGGIYARSNNTGDITGDSYSLAYNAGALLRDVEFVQFYPSMMFSPLKVTISNPLFGEGATLRNAHNERFMHKYDQAAEMATRDIMSRSIFNEIKEGRGHQGCIFMDCRHLPEEILTTKYAEILRLLAKANLNPLKDLIPISPAVHFSMGGVVIDSRTQTSVPGLLACGEAVGGLHGANRLAGNALPETFVFGMIAGQHAAEAFKKGAYPETNAFDVRPFGKGNLSLPELQKDLRKTTWNYLSIIKTRESGQKALQAIDRLALSIEDVGVETVYDLASFYELKSMLTTARLIVQGSLARKESRGSHFRSDYPQIDDENFKGSFFYKNEKGRLTLEFRSTPA